MCNKKCATIWAGSYFPPGGLKSFNGFYMVRYTQSIVSIFYLLKRVCPFVVFYFSIAISVYLDLLDLRVQLVFFAFFYVAFRYKIRLVRSLCLCTDIVIRYLHIKQSIVGSK